MISNPRRRRVLIGYITKTKGPGGRITGQQAREAAVAVLRQ